MKTLIALILSVLCSLTALSAATSISHTYLKIKLDGYQEISYPPGTGFVVENANGDTILSPKQLQEIKEYVIKEPVTLWVFTAWNDEPDTYELSSGKLLMVVSDYDYDASKPYDFGRFKKRNTYVRAKKRETSGKSKKNETYGKINEEEVYENRRGASNGVYIYRERFFSYDKETGYDTSLEFNNDVVFYYRDGEAKAYQNGKDLKIKGKYLIYTNTGIIKLSYNPRNKEIWYVFDKYK